MAGPSSANRPARPSTRASVIFPRSQTARHRPEMAVDENVSLANLAAVARGGLIDRARERRQAQRYVDQLRIKTASVASDVESLSGGNHRRSHSRAGWRSRQRSSSSTSPRRGSTSVRSRDPRAHAGARRARSRGAHDLVRASRNSRHERSRCGHARRRDRRRAVSRRRYTGTGAGNGARPPDAASHN